MVLRQAAPGFMGQPVVFLVFHWLALLWFGQKSTIKNLFSTVLRCGRSTNLSTLGAENVVEPLTGYILSHLVDLHMSFFNGLRHRKVDFFVGDEDLKSGTTESCRPLHINFQRLQHTYGRLFPWILDSHTTLCYKKEKCILSCRRVRTTLCVVIRIVRP